MPSESQPSDREAALRRFSERDARTLGVYFPDLNGLPRGKEVAAPELERALEEGFGLTASIFALDYGGDAVEGTGLGPEILFRDMTVRPDPEAMRECPWRPEAMITVADVEYEGKAAPFAPRTLLRRVVDDYRGQGLEPVIGVELEFHVLRENEKGFEPYDALPGAFYTPLGPSVDPAGFMELLHSWSEEMALPATLLAREFSFGQYEINLGHTGAFEAVDDAFLFKIAAKEAAARSGLLATFIGRPLESLGGNGLHFHFSMADSSGNNLFYDDTDRHGISTLAQAFIGGCMEHLLGSAAVMAPNVNAYKRFATLSLAPYYLTWGLDNRTATIRVPAEREAGTRVEHRLPDGAANLYTCAALILAAGLDGIRRNLDPGEPFAENASVMAELDLPTVPNSLREALAVMERDEAVIGFLGPAFVQAFTALKRTELRRFDATVTEWETRHYARHL